MPRLKMDFRSAHEKPVSRVDSLIESEPSDRNPDAEEVLLCRKCFQIVTTSGERINVNGSHHHSFANPHGIVFEIGCFRAAPGCRYSEESSSEFTWFAGFRWKVAVCRSCLSHLGWLFVSSNSSFNGLILGNLIVCKEEGDKS